jgi:hypothetical protein
MKLESPSEFRGWLHKLLVFGYNPTIEAIQGRHAVREVHKLSPYSMLVKLDNGRQFCVQVTEVPVQSTLPLEEVRP